MMIDVDIDKWLQKHPTIAIRLWIRVHKIQSRRNLSEKEIEKAVQKIFQETIRYIKALQGLEQMMLEEIQNG